MIKTSNITIQEKGDSLVALLDSELRPLQTEPRSFDHIVWRADSNESLTPTETQVAKAMRVAQKKSPDFNINVNSILSQDHSPISKEIEPYFDTILKCERNVREISEFKTHIPLPFLFDILRGNYTTSMNSEFVIFTNFDIIPLPWFYRAISKILSYGFDSLIINRRTILSENKNVDPCILHADLGQIHGGMDCFVFPKEWLFSFLPTKAVLGRGHVMRSLLFNMCVKATNMLYLSDVHLTAHMGDDRNWMTPNNLPVLEHNKQESQILWKLLSKNDDHREKLLALGDAIPKYRP